MAAGSKSPRCGALGSRSWACVGADARRTAERAAINGVSESFTDVGEAIKRTGAKAAAISTPPNLHAEVTLAAISHGCHVLCEKPFASNVAQARAMLAAAQSAGVVYMVGHGFASSPNGPWWPGRSRRA